MTEAQLLTGALEPTNESYAIAKIAGIKLCQAYRRQYGSNFISAMPTNLYGPNDNFDLKNSHVLPAMMRKFHDAKVAGDARGRDLGHRARRAASSCTASKHQALRPAALARYIAASACWNRLRECWHAPGTWPRRSRR